MSIGFCHNVLQAQILNGFTGGGGKVFCTAGEPDQGTAAFILSPSKGLYVVQCLDQTSFPYRRSASRLNRVIISNVVLGLAWNFWPSKVDGKVQVRARCVLEGNTGSGPHGA